MTQTLFLSQLRNLALIVVAYCAGRGWLSSQDSGAITAVLVPVGAIAGPWIWSIYVNLNSRLVHVDSAAAKVATIEAAHPIDALNAASRLAEKVATVLLLAFVISAFLAAPSAMAQGRKVVAPTPHPVVCDPANLLPGCKQAATAPTLNSASDPLAKLMNDLANIQQDVVKGVIDDINAADVDAATLLNPSDPTSFKDPISHACYPAEVKFLQSLPVATAPTGKFVLVQLFQKKRDFVMQIQAGLPVYLKLGCAPLLGDELAIFTKSMSLIGVSIASNMLLPGSGLLLPSL